ncbi:MAG: methylated-DNA--[protein]-cysteine S-methyltransferase [Thermodesulfobacteriota bacterium]
MPEKSTARHFVFQTPFGKGAFVFREKPFVILEVLLPRSSFAKLRAALKRGYWGEPGTHPRAERLSRLISGYFNGKVDPKFWPPWEWLDLTGLTPLQRSVLYATAAIPYGSVCTYRQLAAAIDRPRACRFVGSTMAMNPYPILIPCHRVVRSDGSIGRFRGGTDLKRELIEREAAFASTAG